MKIKKSTIYTLSVTETEAKYIMRSLGMTMDTLRPENKPDNKDLQKAAKITRKMENKLHKAIYGNKQRTIENYLNEYFDNVCKGRERK